MKRTNWHFFHFYSFIFFFTCDGPKLFQGLWDSTGVHTLWRWALMKKGNWEMFKEWGFHRNTGRGRPTSSFCNSLLHLSVYLDNNDGGVFVLAVGRIQYRVTFFTSTPISSFFSMTGKCTKLGRSRFVPSRSFGNLPPLELTARMEIVFSFTLRTTYIR